MNANKDQNKIKVLRLIDGKPGHEKQTSVLVDALSQISPLTCQCIKVNDSLPNGVLRWARGIFPMDTEIVKPDIIIGAGHRTHMSLLTAQKVFGGKTVVVMKPTLPYRLFDLCIVPEHDNPPTKDNIIVSDGPFNPIRPTQVKDDGLGFFMIGGLSKHFDWSDTFVISQIDKVISAKSNIGIKWKLTTSRRTPVSFLQNLKISNFKNLELYSFEETSSDWLEEKLIDHKQVWVTKDSVSMIHEAISNGNNVGILEIPSYKNKFRKNTVHKANSLPVTNFTDWMIDKKWRTEKFEQYRIKQELYCNKIIEKILELVNT